MLVRTYIKALCIAATSIALWSLAYSDTNEIRHPRLIEKISVQGNRLSITPNTHFKSKYLKDNFFAEYDSYINLEQFDESVLSLPFIMNVISIIWISGNRYTIDVMDEELYNTLNRVKRVFQTMYPKTAWDGELIPLKLTQQSRTPLIVSNQQDQYAKPQTIESDQLCHAKPHTMLIPSDWQDQYAKPQTIESHQLCHAKPHTTLIPSDWRGQYAEPIVSRDQAEGKNSTPL